MANLTVSFQILDKTYNYPVIEYKGKLTLLSKQVAELLDVKSDNIKRNFSNNNSKFKLNSDYFILEGQELSDFKDCYRNVTEIDEGNIVPLVDLSLRINKLYLWSERGVFNHVKISSSEKAWDVYRDIVEFYFNNRALINSDSEMLSLKNSVSDLVRAVTDSNQQIAIYRNEMVKFATALQEMKPKVENYNQFMDFKDSFSMEVAAKTISVEHGNGKVIGKNTLFNYLREKKVFTRNNFPYQQYIASGYFEVKFNRLTY